MIFTNTARGIGGLMVEVGKNTGLYNVTLKQGAGTRLTANWLPAGPPGA